ncbi:hypothetical protein [Streptomyces pakalii]|uniref:Uncharacterized protein n=1 Tax=Streptomyces pakalii TaxID=3036494 RepID=A0ABT7DDZ7_9ACTN|nr:hypothetical protein [Streptomyces pakalii]MDJ1644017.1 hypothetical protein [Streptomyces pakalii]
MAVVRAVDLCLSGNTARVVRRLAEGLAHRDRQPLVERLGKRRGRGPLVHDDLVGRDFTADGSNRPGLTDITEHPTAERKLSRRCRRR